MQTVHAYTFQDNLIYDIITVAGFEEKLTKKNSDGSFKWKWIKSQLVLNQNQEIIFKIHTIIKSASSLVTRKVCVISGQMTDNLFQDLLKTNISSLLRSINRKGQIIPSENKKKLFNQIFGEGRWELALQIQRFGFRITCEDDFNQLKIILDQLLESDQPEIILDASIVHLTRCLAQDISMGLAFPMSSVLERLGGELLLTYILEFLNLDKKLRENYIPRSPCEKTMVKVLQEIISLKKWEEKFPLALEKLYSIKDDNIQEIDFTKIEYKIILENWDNIEELITTIEEINSAYFLHPNNNWKATYRYNCLEFISKIPKKNRTAKVINCLAQLGVPLKNHYDISFFNKFSQRNYAVCSKTLTTFFSNDLKLFPWFWGVRTICEMRPEGKNFLENNSSVLCYIINGNIERANSLLSLISKAFGCGKGAPYSQEEIEAKEAQILPSLEKWLIKNRGISLKELDQLLNPVEGNTSRSCEW